MLVLALVFVVSSLLLVHPFVTYPLSLMIIKRLGYVMPIRRGRADPAQKVDIVFCAYNEERSLDKKIENCLAIKAADPSVEIRCYSDGSSDATPRILEVHAAAFPVIISHQRLGKSTGMNTMLRNSSADLIVFTDANTTLDMKAIETVKSYFADPDVGCVCGNLIYVNPDESTTANVGSIYWRLEQLIKKLETETGSTMGADGALFALRRELFSDVPAHIIDDMYTSLSTIAKGKRIIQSDDFIAYERSVTKSGEEFRRKVRISCRAFNCHRLIWRKITGTGPLNAYKYISHKLIRWLAGLWMVISGVSFLALVTVAGFWWLGLLAAIAAAGLYWAGHTGRLGIAASLNEIAISFIATTFGVWKSLRGERFQTWAVAATARASES